MHNFQKSPASLKACHTILYPTFKRLKKKRNNRLFPLSRPQPDSGRAHSFLRTPERSQPSWSTAGGGGHAGGPRAASQERRRGPESLWWATGSSQLRPVMTRRVENAARVSPNRWHAEKTIRCNGLRGRLQGGDLGWADLGSGPLLQEVYLGHAAEIQSWWEERPVHETPPQVHFTQLRHWRAEFSAQLRHSPQALELSSQLIKRKNSATPPQQKVKIVVTKSVSCWRSLSIDYWNFLIQSVVHVRWLAAWKTVY